MKITFLGTGTSTGIPSIGLNYPVCASKDFRDKRLRSSILINHNKKILSLIVVQISDNNF